jgi:hypothetical protein
MPSCPLSTRYSRARNLRCVFVLRDSNFVVLCCLSVVQAGMASDARAKLLGHPGWLSFDADG